MILAMQHLGCGMTGAAVIGRLLSICFNPMASCWNRIEEKIGKAQIKLGEEIIVENINKEKKLSEKTCEGKSKLCVSIDAGWNNRGSGSSYNSDSGNHTITVGNRSRRFVVLHYMSKRCNKCEKEAKLFLSKSHDDGVCSRNYFGLPRERKPMELSRVSPTYI
jgi:hypothetical protein